MIVPALPVHRTFAIVLGATLAACSIGGLLLLGGMTAVVPTAFLAALFLAIWYWGSFRWHWRVQYEWDESGIRLTRSGRILRNFPSSQILAAQNSRGAVTLRLRDGGSFLIHPAHSADELAAAFT